MHSCASGCFSEVIEEATKDAESRIAPAAVTHERSDCGERKKTRAGTEVWVSSMSANHSDHECQSCSVFSRRSIMVSR